MRGFLCVFFILCMVAPAYAETCSDDVISKRVSTLMLDLNQSSQAISIARQVEFGVKKGFVKPERRDLMLEAALEYYLRKTEECNVPQALNERVSHALTLGKSDGERCASGQFDKAVNRQFSTIKDSGGYEVFEQMVRQQVSSLIIADAGDIFVERWDSDPKFRENAIKAGLEMGVMQVSGCSNPESPILRVLATF